MHVQVGMGSSSSCMISLPFKDDPAMVMIEWIDPSVDVYLQINKPTLGLGDIYILMKSQESPQEYCIMIGPCQTCKDNCKLVEIPATQSSRAPWNVQSFHYSALLSSQIITASKSTDRLDIGHSRALLQGFASTRDLLHLNSYCNELASNNNSSTISTPFIRLLWHRPKNMREIRRDHHLPNREDGRLSRRLYY